MVSTRIYCLWGPFVYSNFYVFERTPDFQSTKIFKSAAQIMSAILVKGLSITAKYQYAICVHWAEFEPRVCDRGSQSECTCFEVHLPYFVRIWFVLVFWDPGTCLTQSGPIVHWNLRIRCSNWSDVSQKSMPKLENLKIVDGVYYFNSWVVQNETCS